MEAVKRELPTRYSEAEWAARVDLAAAYRVIAMYGWDDQVASHLSVKVPGPEQAFLIVPFGVFFEEVTASCLQKVDLDGNLLSPSDYIINRAGFVIHSAVYMARPDVTCAVHLHTVAGTGVGAQEQGLLPLSAAAMILWGKIAYHTFEGVSVDEEERKSLKRDLGDNWCLMLRNHGTLTVGRTVGEAMQRIYYLERACQMQVAAQSGGGKLVLPAPAIADAVKEQRKQVSTNTADLAWAALKRKVARECPGFDS